MWTPSAVVGQTSCLRGWDQCSHRAPAGRHPASRTRDQDLLRTPVHVTRTWWENFYMWPRPGKNTSTCDQDLVRTLLHVTRNWWEHFYTWPGPGENISTRDQDLVSTLLHVTRTWWVHFYTWPGPGEYTSTRDQDLVRTFLHETRTWWVHFYTWSTNELLTSLGLCEVWQKHCFLHKSYYFWPGVGSTSVLPFRFFLAVFPSNHLASAIVYLSEQKMLN